MAVGQLDVRQLRAQQRPSAGLRPERPEPALRVLDERHPEPLAQHARVERAVGLRQRDAPIRLARPLGLDLPARPCGELVAIDVKAREDHAWDDTAMEGVRLRQVVLVARELEDVAGQLREELGLGEPFADPGVGEFGLSNAVFALGDQFIEVISPKQDGTAAGRWLERHGGDGGYMLIFQLDDLDAARARAADMGIRTVWQIDLPDISGTHLHPADTRGALISLDAARPPGSWRWGGPGWEERAVPGRVDGVTVGVREPGRVEQIWTDVLGARPPGITFAADEHEPGFTEVAVSIPGRSDTLDIGGVRFRLEDQ